MASGWQETPIIMNNLTSLPTYLPSNLTPLFLSSSLPFFDFADCVGLSDVSFLHSFLPSCRFREFAKEKERVENKAGYMQLKEREKLDREMNG